MQVRRRTRVRPGKDDQESWHAYKCRRGCTKDAQTRRGGGAWVSLDLGVHVPRRDGVQGDARPGHTSGRASIPPRVPRSTPLGGRGHGGPGECQTSRDSPKDSELTAVKHLKQERESPEHPKSPGDQGTSSHPWG